MVRIFKVNTSEEKKRVLIARSEVYRQTLALDITNVKLSTAVFRTRFGLLKSAYRFLGVAGPLLGLVLGHTERRQKRGLLSRLFSGLNLFGQVKSLFNGYKAAQDGVEEPESPTRFP